MAQPPVSALHFLGSPQSRELILKGHKAPKIQEVGKLDAQVQELEEMTYGVPVYQGLAAVTPAKRWDVAEHRKALLPSVLPGTEVKPGEMTPANTLVLADVALEGDANALANKAVPVSVGALAIHAQAVKMAEAVMRRAEAVMLTNAVVPGGQAEWGPSVS